MWWEKVAEIFYSLHNESGANLGEFEHELNQNWIYHKFGGKFVWIWRGISHDISET